MVRQQNQNIYISARTKDAGAAIRVTNCVAPARAWQLKTHHERDIELLVFCWHRLAHRLADGSRRETFLLFSACETAWLLKKRWQKHGCCVGLCV